MGRNIHASKRSFTISGTGNAVGSFDFNPAITSTAVGGSAQASYVRYSGKVRRFYVRQATGGGATAATFYALNNNNRTAVAAASVVRDDVVFLTAAVPLTASATTPSLDTPIDAEPVFKDSLSLVADVTAVGAWTLTGFVELVEG